MFACLWPISTGTAGPIWLILILLALSWIPGQVFPNLDHIRFNTNKFLDWASGFQDPKSGFLRKIRQYTMMCYNNFHILIIGSSFLALNVQFFQHLLKIFQDKGKNHQIYYILYH